MNIFDVPERPMAVIDGLNFAYRALHVALAQNRPLGFLPGYRAMLRKVAKAHDKMVVAYDMGDNFRVDYYKGYKSNRGDRSIDHKEMRDLTSALGYHVVVKPGLEADDIIVGIAKQYPCIVYTSDKDLLCVVSETVQVQTQHKLMDIAAVKAKWGVPPHKISDLLALTGDDGDDFKGAPGIGVKRAAKLLKGRSLAKAILKTPSLGDAIPNLIASSVLARPHVYIPDLPADLRPKPPDKEWLKRKGLHSLV